MPTVSLTGRFSCSHRLFGPNAEQLFLFSLGTATTTQSAIWVYLNDYAFNHYLLPIIAENGIIMRDF
jgi:hypothetical protein